MPAKCECGKYLENDRTELFCKNPRCLKAYFYRDAACDKCGKAPAVVDDVNMKITTFICPESHKFIFITVGKITR